MAFFTPCWIFAILDWTQQQLSLQREFCWTLVSWIAFLNIFVRFWSGLKGFSNLSNLFRFFCRSASILTCSFCIFLLHDLNKSATPVSSTRLHTFNPNSTKSTKSTKSFKLSLSDFIFGVRVPLEDVSKFHWWFLCAQTWLVIGCMSEDMSSCWKIWSILTLRNTSLLMRKTKQPWCLERYFESTGRPESSALAAIHKLWRKIRKQNKALRRFNGWSKMMWTYMRSFLSNFEYDFHTCFKRLRHWGFALFRRRVLGGTQLRKCMLGLTGGAGATKSTILR